MAAHIRARPEDDADRLGITPLVADVLLDECISKLFSILPCGRGRHTARVKAIEIPPRRQHIHAVCRRRTRRARLNVSARECPQRLRDLALRAAQTRHHIPRDLAQRMGKCGTRFHRGCGNNREHHRPLDRLRCIVMCAKKGDQRTHLRLDRIQLSAVGHAVRCHTLAVREELLIVITCLLCDQAEERFFPAMFHAYECAQEINHPIALGCTAEDMQTRTDLHILDVSHVVVKSVGIVIEIFAFVNLPLEMTGSRLFTDNIPHSLDVVRLRCAEVDVLIECLFQFLDLLESARKLHRRREMTNQACRTAPLCLNPLSDNRDPVGIDVRQIAKRDIRIARIREPRPLTRQPLKRAVRPDVNDRVCPPDIAQPMIVADVVMCGGGIGRVQEFAGILAESARRLYRDEDISIQRTRDEESTVVIEHIPRSLSPVPHEPRPHLRGQLREKCAVLLCRQLSVGRLCLRRTHKAAVVRRVICQQLHKRLAALRDLIHDIVCGTHRREQTAHALGGVQSRRAADV